MKTLEIVVQHERVLQKQQALQQVWPALTRVAQSSFFYVFACQIEELASEQKKWLEDLYAAKDIIAFRCKDRNEKHFRRK